MRRINYKAIVIDIVIFVLIFQSIFEQVISQIKYFDEALAIVSLVYGIVKAWNNRHNKVEKLLILMAISVLNYAVVGSVSSWTYQYQSIQLTMAGALVSLKWFVLMLGGYFWGCNSLNQNDIRNIKYISCIYAYIYLVLVVCVNVMKVDLYMVYPWDLCGKCVFMAAVIVACWDNTVTDMLTIVCILSLLVYSNKAKGYAAIVLIVGCIFLIIIRGKRLTTFSAIIGVGAILFVARDKIYFYYVRGRIGDFARYRLIATAVDIANDYFPLGTGWSTYGSFFSVVNYSKVYYLYGIDKHRELGVASKIFLNDNYWACVIGETGWIGAFSIALFCIFLFLLIQNKSENNKNYYAAALLLLCYMIVTTVEETGFAQPVLSCIGVCEGVMIALLNNAK